MPSAGAAGADALARVGRRLRAAGTEGQGLRRRLRRNLLITAEPMKTAVQTAITAIPAKGPKHTGLRSAMRKATKLRVRTTGSQVGVRLEVAPGAMPAGKENLPAYMEGRARWRHPYFGTGTWVGQASHPYFDRTVMPYVVKARRGAELAVKETADSI